MVMIPIFRSRKKYRPKFPQGNGPGIQGVGLKDGKNVRFDQLDDRRWSQLTLTSRSGTVASHCMIQTIAELTNQLEVNRYFLRASFHELECRWRRGQLRRRTHQQRSLTDGKALVRRRPSKELFVSYQDAWISSAL